ncbi:MAG: hypothetical protein ACREED_03810, partial [Stellaceae bacterium]
ARRRGNGDECRKRGADGYSEFQFHGAPTLAWFDYSHSMILSHFDFKGEFPQHSICSASSTATSPSRRSSRAR